MKFCFLLAGTAAAFALVGGTAAPAAPAHFSPAAIVKTCSSGYRHAGIGGAERSLRAGHFCAHRFDRQYRRYGFRCTRYYRNVHRYRLTYG